MGKRIEQKVEALMSPIQTFVSHETVGGAILLAATVAALLLANSGLSERYFELVHFPIGLSIGDTQIHSDVRSIINNGLMTLFFLILGLEIKRELLVGELQDRRFAMTVFTAAMGGMLAPALIYCMVNWHMPTLGGWGIPMATDTAFALGVLLLLGDHVPQGLKVFMLAYAIIDDIGAIIVIAAFYSEA
jgi:NhaA family Na+:H+ antiporter